MPAKSLSGYRNCIEGRKGAGEVDHGEEVGCFLFPADEEPSGAVEPAVGTFDHPAPRFPVRSTLGAIFAAAAQMQAIFVGEGQLEADGIVVTLVQTKSRPALQGWPNIFRFRERGG